MGRMRKRKEDAGNSKRNLCFRDSHRSPEKEDEKYVSVGQAAGREGGNFSALQGI